MAARRERASNRGSGMEGGFALPSYTTTGDTTLAFLMNSSGRG